MWNIYLKVTDKNWRSQNLYFILRFYIRILKTYILYLDFILEFKIPGKNYASRLIALII